MDHVPTWWAKGLLLENCNCRLLCRCHISYRQPADHERCLGFLAARIDDGAYGDVPLGGLQAVVLVDAPQIMTEPDWALGICIDERANQAQREAVERILSGQAGSGWGVLGALVARRLETQIVPIDIQHNEAACTVRVGDVLEASLAAAKGADKSGPPRLENVHNQVHGPSEVLAWGSTHHKGELHHRDTEETHAIWSRFSWRGP
jgi:hypothetical protein